MATNYFNQRAVIRTIGESDGTNGDYLVAFPFNGCRADAIPVFNTKEGISYVTYEYLRAHTTPADDNQIAIIRDDISRFGYYVKVVKILPSVKYIEENEGNVGLVGSKNFEELLWRYFGLDIELHSDVDPNEEEREPNEYFTEEGWDAWGRYIDLVKDMQSLGLLEEGVADRAIEKVWDIVWDD